MDKHLPESQFELKVRDKMGYVLFEDGKKLMEHWEADMKTKGFGMAMVSTQVDENAQHFYRKLGYKDSGGFILDIPGYEQPMEMIMTKKICLNCTKMIFQNITEK